MTARLYVVFLLVTGCSQKPPTVEKFGQIIQSSEAREGLLSLRVDVKAGKIYLAVPPQTEAEDSLGKFLYVDGLVTGLGSNPVGLDRGRLGETRLVHIRRVGERVVIEQENLGFRALSQNATEQRASDESFATSILWAGRVEAQSDDGRGLVDLSGFVLRDVGVLSQLRGRGQGEYDIDLERSVVDTDRVLAFPDNVVLESVITYAARTPGDEVAKTAPMGDSFALRHRFTLVRLPDDAYEPRAFDPRLGALHIEFVDYASGLADPMIKRWAVRHRISEEPIVYYVDAGAPEPVRSALVEGASWWADAFQAAGHPGKFRVAVLPEDAHPLDVRYNVIQWVHRSTRGWSYGGGVIDPRTGERLKGHVSLGSLRVRQDRRIFEGLSGTAKTGSGASDDPVELSLARLRQLSAHEVGHALGFAHNFAASASGRASVMDYPAPLVRVKGDALDFSQAYATGMGAWDVLATRHLYGKDDASALVKEARENGIRFLSETDARSMGAAHPLNNLWDNGEDPVAELDVVMAVRAHAIAHFGVDRLPKGASLSELNEVFAPVYFYHRYQVAATAKSVGGLVYDYRLQEDAVPATPVPAGVQEKALAALLTTLTPEALDIPENVLSLLVPRAHGVAPNREMFQSDIAPAFDALRAARTAADLTVVHLLNAARAGRMVDQHRRDETLPDFSLVLDKLVKAAFGAPAKSPRLAALQREVQGVLVSRMIELGANPAASSFVRRHVLSSLKAVAPKDPLLKQQIDRFVASPIVKEKAQADVLDLPPGSPIGCGS